METTGVAEERLDNPFEYTRPIADRQRTMQRGAAVRSILACLRNNECASVLAPRQTGKTTFLHALRQAIVVAPHEACVYVDFDGADYADMGELTADFARRIGAPARGAGRGGPPLLKFLRELREERGRVFLIDEIRSLKNLAVEFLQHVRAYYMEGVSSEPERVHKFVIAGSIDLADLTLEEDPAVSPYNMARNTYLGDFGHDEVREFIARRAGDAFSERAVGLIFEHTNGHPYLVQFLCNHLYGLPPGEMERRLGDLPKLVHESGAEGQVNIESMVRHLFETRAESDETLKLLEAILEGDRLPFAESNRSIRTLYMKHGCIRREEDYCAIRNPIYGLVLRRNFDICRAAQISAAPPGPGAADAAGDTEGVAEDRSRMLETFTRVEKQLETFARVERRLEALFPHAWLKNYSGFLCVRVAPGADADAILKGEGKKSTYRVDPGQQLRLLVWLQPEQGFPEGTLYRQFAISDGADAEEDGTPVGEILFEVAVDAEGVEVGSRSQRDKVPVDRRSGDFEFLATAPAEAGSYPVWVQTLQGNRLLQVLDLTIVVPAAS
jgi:hypothetical protein